jgi:1-acyl-sn-glycerol-3-phosphate acyltransferase
MFRLVLVVLVVVPATLWYGLRVLWHAYRGTPPGAEIFREAPRRWSRLILRVSGVKVAFENASVIDAGRPQILVANHVSWFDVLALSGHLPGRWVFVAKRELADVPLFGRAAAACGQIFIDRQDRNAAIQSLEAARRRLEEERPTVIMFPEGTRSPDGNLQPFKKGAFVLAIQSGVEIVPAAISGSRDVMPKGSLRIRPGTITVRFGRPIEVEGLGAEDRNNLTERAWRALAALQQKQPTLNEPA